jgi:hypothetical protein
LSAKLADAVSGALRLNQQQELRLLCELLSSRWPPSKRLELTHCSTAIGETMIHLSELS